MDKKKLSDVVKEIKGNSKERNFTQTFDLIVNLQNLDLKKPEHKVDIGVVLKTPIKSKGLKICAIVDRTIVVDKIFDRVLYNDEIDAVKNDIKEIRKITHKFDKFVVQANFMPIFAQVFGKYLGPMGKMPSPKLGMIVNPKTQFQDLRDKLQKTVHLQTKKNLVLQASVGSVSTSDEEIIANVENVLSVLENELPNQKHNIKNVALKLTMGSPIKL